MIQLFRYASASAVFALAAGVATGETVTSSEFKKDQSGYPCLAELITDADKSVSVNLSDYKDVWSVNFYLSDRASVYRRFFNNRGLHDKDALEDSFSIILIGESSFDIHDSTLFAVQLKDVDEKTTGIFSVKEKHNVVGVLNAMKDDGVAIPGLVSLDGTADALGEFLTCSYSAMGLRNGERVETDYRAEYRMMFEGAFDRWLTSMSRAEHCLVRRFDNHAVDEVIEAAANAFYPRVLSFRKRREFREQLKGRLPFAKLSGLGDAKSEGCLMAGRMVELSRIPVDSSIQAAADLD